MDSKEMNEALSVISDKGEEYGFIAFPDSGKAIPYIGWYWRTVDFEHKGTYAFGVIPDEETGKSYIGFMENNKWGYGYVIASAEEWEKIKSLLRDVISNPCATTLRAANEAIQGIGK